MKLHYWAGSEEKKNFGDELNNLIWPRYLPGILNEDASSIFIGIGTLLNVDIQAAAQNVVMGSGAGYGLLPVMNGRWDIYAVRGPLSAEALKLDKSKAVIDPGILINRMLYGISLEKKWKYGYMPHWKNADLEWESICIEAGWLYISPLLPVDKVLNMLAGVECLVAEAMHGAIVADAMRIPWIPVTDMYNSHTLPFKWQDWCQSVNLEYLPVFMNGVRQSQVLPVKERMRLRNEHVNFCKRIVLYSKPVLSNSSHLETQIARLEDVIMQFQHDIERKVLPRNRE